MKTPTNGNGRPGRLQQQDARPELVDLQLERQFLASCMMGFPELVLSSGVIESDFYSTPHARVWVAMLHLTADGVEINSETLRAYLHERGQLATLGGEDFILGLTDTVPYSSVDSTRLRRLARTRRLQEAARAIAMRPDPDALPVLLERFESARRDLEAVQAQRSKLRTLADVVPLISALGPRLPIGLPTLDEATRGGLPLGKVVTFVGAPGASKTNLTTWLADGWERTGCAVMFLAADEARQSIVVRLGQLDGFDRDALESADPGRRSAFERQSRPRALSVIDPFDDRVSLEEAEKLLLELACGKPRVLIVDSLQTVPCETASVLETRREQIEAVMGVIVGIAKRGALVIAISEMARAGYRTGKREHDISALAAAAETRAIEFGSDLMLGLRPVRGERGLVDVETAKNRIGTERPELRLTLDFQTLRFREIARPVDEEGDREAKKAAVLRARILEAVAKDSFKTASQVVRAIGGRKRDGSSMIRELLEEGALIRAGGFLRAGLGTAT